MNLDDPKFESRGENILYQAGTDILQPGDAVSLTGEFETKIMPFSVTLGEPLEGEPSWVYKIRQNGRVRVSGAYPIKLGGNTSARIATTDVVRQELDCSGEDAIDEQPSGAIPFYDSGVYFCTQLSISGAWDEISGMSMDLSPAGLAGCSLEAGVGE